MERILKKNKHKILACAGIVLLLSLLMMAAISATKKYVRPSNPEIARQLKWLSTPDANDSLCDGYFSETNDIRHYPNPPNYEKSPTHITAKGPTVFSKTGTSMLQQDVRVTQKGRLSRSDKAYIDHDDTTGKITKVHLIGHVRMQEHNKLLVSKNATLHANKNTVQLNHVLYHIVHRSKKLGESNIWGSAEKGNQLPNGIITLDHATYSSCAPIHPTWEITATHIEINQKKGVGVVKNAVLKLKGIPILYSPYLSFSTNRERKSGWFMPSFASSSKNGFTLGLPYYWNMAPNYDMTFTPTYYSKRGYQLNAYFRYLTKHSYGNLTASYLPNDRKFRHFKQETFSQFPEPIAARYQPYIDALRSDHNYRAYFSYNNHTLFNKAWALNIQLHHVTDSYYFRNFGSEVNDVVANQLLNRIDLNYSGEHWNFTLLAQAYQTLHQINQSNSPTINQYMRLPELDALAEYPHIFSGINFELNAQLVNFAYFSRFPPLTDQLPAGQRLHLRPTFTRPINWVSGYLTPGISVDSTTYHVTRPLAGQETDSTRNLPIIDIDSGLYFNRHFHWGKKHYTQTLEPRLFYLYVPFENQNHYPIYDTQLLPFTYAQLFARDSFTGYDRLQNANQINIGMTSRFLGNDGVTEYLKMSLGMGYFISHPRICLTAVCTALNPRFTPLVTELTYHPNPRWSIVGGFSWDTQLSQTNNAQVNVNYNNNGRYIIGGGYTFLQGQPLLPGYPTTLQNANTSIYNFHLAWPLNKKWSALGYLYYNATENRSESYFAGLQYDICCFSFRFIVDRTYLGVLPVNSGAQNIRQYSTNYMVQIQFKGIGNTGNADPHAMLEAAIPGYRDPFNV